MGMFSYRDLDAAQILEAAHLSNAAYPYPKGEPIPTGYRPITPAELGLAANTFDGVYYKGVGGTITGFGSARALPLISNDEHRVVIAFRGTDSKAD